MRKITTLVLLLALSPTAAPGPIDDQFGNGFGGVPWGMKLDDLIALIPGGDQYFSTADGERSYSVLNEDPLFEVPRPGMRIQYHFGIDGGVQFIGIALPYERREELLGALYTQFGRYAKMEVVGTSIRYSWYGGRRVGITVKASRDARNGILEFWLMTPSKKKKE